MCVNRNTSVQTMHGTFKCSLTLFPSRPKHSAHSLKTLETYNFPDTANKSQAIVCRAAYGEEADSHEMEPTLPQYILVYEHTQS